MKGRKSFALIVCLSVFAAALLAGCGTTNTNSNAVKENSSSKENKKPDTDSVGEKGEDAEGTANSQKDGEDKAAPGGEQSQEGQEDQNGQDSPDGENGEEAEPVEPLTDPIEIEGLAEGILSGMTLNEKIGQMFMLSLESLDESQGSYYEFKECNDRMKNTLSFYQPGGVAFFSRNIETRDQTSKLIQDLQENSKIPMFIGVDEEGGDVARIANNPNMRTTKFPSMEEIGASKDEEKAYEAGYTIGTEIKELGFNLDFAPVADVRTNEMNTEIGNRSFGDDAKLVGKMAAKVVEGLDDAGVSATLKHFPGHGDVSEDSHKGPVNVDNDLNRLRKVEFVPFKSGIKAGADFVMISHISISRVTENTEPASLSKAVLQTLLRDEMGFEGIAITDAMDMEAITKEYSAAEAAVAAVRAGEDILLMPEDFSEAFQAVWDAVQQGKIKEKRIDESVKRILTIKIKRGLILPDTELLPEELRPEA